MNTYAILVVNQHLESLLAEAAHERLVKVPRPSLRDRVASKMSSVRSAIAEPADPSASVLPALNDYPYRS